MSFGNVDCHERYLLTTVNALGVSRILAEVCCKNPIGINDVKYIMYKAYNGAIFSLQIKDLLEVYIKSHKRDVAVFKKDGTITIVSSI